MSPWSRPRASTSSCKVVSSRVERLLRYHSSKDDRCETTNVSISAEGIVAGVHIKNSPLFGVTGGGRQRESTGARGGFSFGQLFSASSRPSRHQAKGEGIGIGDDNSTMSSCWGSSDGEPPPSNVSAGIYQALERFNAVYKDAHPYFSICVCLFGIFFNVCNVVVLTRPLMNHNPINALLTTIALSDAAVMISYVPFAVWSSRINYCAIYWQTIEWAYFVLFNSGLTVICHAVSIWLTVAMALIRAITVRRKGFAKLWTNRKSYILSLATLVTTVLLYSPGLVSYRVISRPFDADYCLNRTGIDEGPRDDRKLYMYITTVSELGYANRCLLLKSAFWINGVIFKMIPCLLLTVFIGVLLHILTEVKQRKTRLRSGSSAVDAGSQGPSGQRASNARRSSDQSRTTDRTTLMLVVLLAFFLAAELPQGLLLIGTGLASSEFRTRVFMNLGTLTDLLSLLNSAVNFVIYCAMSQKFREVFCQTLMPARLHYRYFCEAAEASTLYATNGNSVAMRNRHSLAPFRNSAGNTAEVSATAYAILQNGARKGKRSDSEVSTSLLRTPTGKKRLSR